MYVANRLQRQGYNLISFSFKEFLNLENRELTEGEIKEKLLSYLTYGGYPEPLVKNIDYKD